MDPATLNALVCIALGFLAVTALMLLGSAIPLFMQASRTLHAYENLADTLQNELKPTLGEVRTMLEGVNELRSLTAERVSEVSHKVEDVAGTMGIAAGEAKKKSSVWGAGLLAGVKAYLDANHGEPKQLAIKRGEQNVELNK